jgi:hypothetical protein
MAALDEALLWARDVFAGQFPSDAPQILAGEFDSWPDIRNRVRAYRAGQAASAERIKALEGVVQGYVNDCTNDECEQCINARARLKESD